MTIKQKLLDAIGDLSISDIGAEALVDILVYKIHALENTVASSNRENGLERQRLYDETLAMREERKKMLRDPMYGAYGEFYFLGRNGTRFCLSMQCGNIQRMFERVKTTDWVMQQITQEQWGILEGQDGKKK